MSSCPVYEFRPPAAAPTPGPSPRPSCGTVVSICDSPAFVRAAENQQKRSEPDGLGCVRGIRAAFVFEGGLALLLYGIWYLWHMVR